MTAKPVSVISQRVTLNGTASDKATRGISMHASFFNVYSLSPRPPPKPKTKNLQFFTLKHFQITYY